MKRFTGRFKTYRRRITIPDFHTQIKLIPFGDVHRHSPACDVTRWHQFLDRAKRDDNENTYYFGMGDYEDFASTSERDILAHPKLHESTTAQFDKYAASLVDQFAEEIEFMRGRLLGLIEGHHFWLFESGLTSTHLLAARFNVPYLGNVCAFRLGVAIGKRNHGCAVDIIAAHGKEKSTSGKTVGHTINGVDHLRRIFPAADIYLMAHDHQKHAASKTILEVETGRGHHLVTKQKRQWLCRTGSFMRGYVEDEDSYVVRELYTPTDLGVVRGEIEIRRDEKGITKDIHFWS